MKALTVDVNGREYDVEVNDSGQFFTNGEEGRIYAETLAKLKEKLKLLCKVNVKVTRIHTGWGYSRKDRPVIEQGELTGINSANGNLTYRSSKGKADQVGRHGDGICRVMTQKEIDHLLVLWDAMAAAENAYQTARESYEVDARQLVEAAAYGVIIPPAKKPNKN